MLEATEKPLKFAEHWQPPDGALRALRDSAMRRYIELGLPHTKLEEWRSTSIRAIVETEFSDEEPVVGDIGAILETVPLAEDAFVAVFVNGRFSRRHSKLEGIPSGVTVAPFSDIDESMLSRLGTIASYEKDAFTAINTARFTDGLFMHVPRETVVERPVFAVFIGTSVTPIACYQRVLALMDENAEATLIESYIVPEDQVVLLNSVCEIHGARKSTLKHAKLQLGSSKAFHITHLQAETEHETRLHQTNVTLGGSLVRNDSRAVLNGEFGEVTLNGLYVAQGEQHIDNHTTLDHAQPNNPSFELYKGILDDRATGVFRGRIIVRPDAQKTDSKQSNMNLILSDDAVAFSKPQLEIFADDVKCTHGATIGKIEDEALFYLRSRGLDIESARNLLTYAFASDVLADFPVPSVRERLELMLFARLAAGEELPESDELRA